MNARLRDLLERNGRTQGSTCSFCQTVDPYDWSKHSDCLLFTDDGKIRPELSEPEPPSSVAASHVTQIVDEWQARVTAIEKERELLRAEFDAFRLGAEMAATNAYDRVLELEQKVRVAENELAVAREPTEPKAPDHAALMLLSGDMLQKLENINGTEVDYTETAAEIAVLRARFDELAGGPLQRFQAAVLEFAAIERDLNRATVVKP